MQYVPSVTITVNSDAGVGIGVAGSDSTFVSAGAINRC